ncbi:DUF982 domain-containing protein [Ruegeria faecimaris]|uniref:DUF982 domain-containing protein n=1 Tax=Ruegeria faecimaris TaxID=686389 RepID=UPI002330A75E|nr:DUF982 domain-containing protein [Ruegeria faecimaris]
MTHDTSELVIPKINETKNMIETHWGDPITLVLSPEGGSQKFSTIEQASYWLRKKWPVANQDRNIALAQIDAAMHCLAPVGAARKAFILAAKTAGFKQDQAGADITAVF